MLDEKFQNPKKRIPTHPKTRFPIGAINIEGL